MKPHNHNTIHVYREIADKRYHRIQELHEELALIQQRLAWTLWTAGGLIAILAATAGYLIMKGHP